MAAHIGAAGKHYRDSLRVLGRAWSAVPTYAREHNKIAAIEGLRGFAALQVFLLHYVTAFLPGTANHDPSRFHIASEMLVSETDLWFAIDGFTAVYVFFLLSGFVLTRAFHNSTSSTLALMVKRFFRLFLPACASILLGFGLMLIIGSRTNDVAVLSHSQDWLGRLYRFEPDFKHLVHDWLFGSMIVGYRETSLFSNFEISNTWRHLTTIFESYNPPLWTLHVELFGSLLVLIIVKLSDTHSWMRWPPIIAVLYYALPNPLALFIVGYFVHSLWTRLAHLGRSDSVKVISTVVGLALIASGVHIGATKNIPALRYAFENYNHYFTLGAANNMLFQSQVAAILLFIGALACIPITKWLGSDLMAFFGKISFSIYLIHVPIMLTLSVTLYQYLWADTSQMALFCIVIGTGFALTVASAVVFEIVIDRKAIRLSNWIAAQFVRKSNVGFRRSGW